MTFAGTTVFLIGGGDSASRIDLGKLRGHGIVVAINDAVRRIPWADIVFSADGIWITRRADVLARFVGRKVAAIDGGYVPPEAAGPIEVLDRSRDVLVSDDPGLIYSAHNSGFAALNFAVSREATRIVLIGFDLDGGNHWHGGYEWKCRFGRADHPKWAAAFNSIAPELARRGVDVVNLNPASAIRGFRFATLDEVLT
jgi:hypothetical protein